MYKPKVLLVNDHPPSLLALETMLERKAQELDFEVITAQSGEQALRHVLQQQLAVILLDISMPGMDGFEVAQIIHSHPHSANLPIIFVTAHYGEEMHRLKGYQSGAVDYLFTPVIPQILQNKVAVFVELARKNLQLQYQTRELESFNRDLQLRQMHDLQRINAALEAEVEERRQAEARAHELATRDPLTGLLNRRSLIQHLEQAVARSHRQRKGLAVLFLDMDRFKSINDSLGHDVGDVLLQQVAARISSAVRVTDLVARLGGDEFVVLMEGLPEYPDAAAVARKIIQANSTPCVIGAHQIKASISIGISLYPQDGETVQMLIKHADLAMYHAKQQRPGTIQFFHEELNRRLSEKVRLEREIQQALENQEFLLYYQPKIEIASGRLVGVEALLRWVHPRLGLIGMGDVLDTIADNSQLLALGDWVIDSACRQARIWQDQGGILGQLPIAINVAAPQIHAGFPTVMRKLLGEHGIAPARLELEITESLLIRDVEMVRTVLQELSTNGIRIAIDDFGTGYSSLSALKALPIDVLKIDRSFIQDLEQGKDNAAIVTAIIDMAKALTLRVVAEGVENQGQLVILQSLGCDQYQGFYHSRPVAASELSELLESGLLAPPQRCKA